ncbi:MAG: LPXTG cell wall anchor domain-containing protein [Lachnospiraceae bacterium]|nr:LPXTG cell wall anchor domain-containing protein [Lachnospiraceae bacterium]
MKNIVNEYIRLFKDNRRARRKTLGFISILTLLVAVGVFWNLHFTGIALTGEVYYCDKEEHQHDEECYAWVLMSDEEDDESAMTAADEDEDETNSTALELETVQNSETGTEEETIYISETEATQNSDTEVAAEEAAQNFETEAAEETAQVSVEEMEEETIQISETDSEKEASQSLETVEEKNTSNSTISSDSNGEVASETSIEEGTEPGTLEDSDTSDNKTDALPAMILLSEATETEEWYLNHGYENVLICDKEEHTHTVKCLMDETADVETAEDWEATLPENLNGTAAENLVAVALSQLGYSESEQNFSLSEDGETKNGYTRYGAWYGNTYGEWNAMFVAFCLHYAGISEDDFPVNSGAYAWAVKLAEADLYAAADDYTPNAGDLIFLDTDEDGKADQVGIVESVTEGALTVSSGESDTEASDAELLSDIITPESQANESETMVYALTVILGDYCDEPASDAEETTADTVCRMEYASDDAAILGYGVLPDVEVNPPVNHTEKKVDSALEEQTLTVVMDDLTVTLSGQLPVDATVSVEPVDLEVEDREVQFALEISIYDADGNEFEPEDDTITVTVESEKITEGCTIYYVPDEGDLEEMTSETENGLVSFDAEHFSTYVGVTTSEEASLYDAYMATIAEYEEQAYALDKGDDASAVAITSDLGDLLSAVDEDYEDEKLTKDEYTEIVDTIDVLWDWLEENFDLYGTSTTEAEGTYNSWTIIADSTDVLSSSYQLSLERSNLKEYSGLLLEEYFLGGQITARISINDIKTEGYTYTFDDNSYLLFENVGTIDEKELDVKITFVSIQFKKYNSWNENSTWAGILRLGFWSNDGGQFSIGMGNTSSDEVRTDGVKHERWAPVETITTIKVEVLYHNADNGVVNSNFLLGVSDIDIYMNQHNGTLQYYEGFATGAGFNGNFYRYAASDGLLNINETGRGYISVYTVSTSKNFSGDDSYKKSGIYAETEGNAWTQQNTTSYGAATLLEIYIPYYSVTLQKLDAENKSTTLSGAEFCLYKTESGTNYYYKSRNEWVTDKNSATKLTTDDTGVVSISELYPGTYYFEEVTAPGGGYNLLSSPIEFTLSMGGTLTTTASTDVASVDTSNSLKMIVYNTPGYELPSTGGSGTILYTTSGLTLIISAAWLMYRQKGGEGSVSGADKS